MQQIVSEEGNGPAPTQNGMDSMDASLIKLDDSIFVDFRKREEKLEEEIRKKDEQIR